MADEGDDATPEPVPVYIHTRPTDGGRDRQGYQPVATVMGNVDTKRMALADALSQLRGWQRRYGWLTELAAVSAAIDRAAAEHAA